jgi:magnesium chelatase family protein
MPSKVTSFVLDGLTAIPAEVETDISGGLPSFTVVGLPDTAVQESRERVRAAVKNTGFRFPLSRITVNLAPADLKKEGPLFDLPIAISLLLASGQILSRRHEGTVFLGELSLAGEVKIVRGILPIVRRAKQLGFHRFIVPAEGAAEASWVEGVEITPVTDLRQAVNYLNGETEIPLQPRSDADLAEAPLELCDFGEIKGQEGAKRALEVAAAGGHHLIMIGSPGAGKTMLARRLVTVMPPLTLAEAVEVTEIYSICGHLPTGQTLIKRRPFRTPHHSISYAGLVGGGTTPSPGEVSLAHQGVLFLDEFPEFRRDVLEALRQPLEEGVVHITRVRGTADFPAQFMLLAAMNPCPCGFALDPKHECRCGGGEIRRYRHKVSGPLWDRFDIHLLVPPLTVEELVATDGADQSGSMRDRVTRCRQRQAERYQNLGLRCNAKLSGKLLRQFCSLEPREKSFLRQAADRLHLTARAYDRSLKLARTIADLEGQEQIHLPHLAEAMQHRGSEDWM